ncbi:bifunctional riboflavin kinase/FAD synthetase [Bacillus suaedaesalsae]|uniref:Riboflavin biosynthesis protein n=1 Tax=Bacillus suaedaesalsae TaxID=2810349 RepID=A0ABS2DIU8_9BACI|nr:bifunctional riboflavin kinase/FAD synthetase [Bacillus suaedaesalsae]MBM6618398.1 bifunctional riboflavin kinase/FAD synthetase [Bacillus suaedaesalsae]
MKTIFISHPHEIKLENSLPKVMALGFFDGVHIGHQKVIGSAKQIADEKGIKSAVMTFYPHPSIVLRRENAVHYAITPLNDKIVEIERLGIDELYVVEFKEQFAQLLPQEFVDDYIIKLNVKHVVAGFDFTYGRMGKGTMETLPFHSRNQFTQTIVPKVEKDDEKVSSTYIRKLLQDGNVSVISSLLGRPYKIKGNVIHGEKRGSTIGFPTANIAPLEDYYIPKIGVYAVKMKIKDEWYNGVCNIGKKPTFHENLANISIEVHLFDFSDMIYGEFIELSFLYRIRDEQKFTGIDQLVERIQIDMKIAKEILIGRVTN